MQQRRSTLVSYVRRPTMTSKVTPTQDKQQYSITYPLSHVDSFTESTKSLGLQPLSPLTTKQLRTNNKRQQNQSLSILPISSDHRLSAKSISNIKTSKNNMIGPGAKHSKAFIIAIIVGIIIGIIALTGLGIGIYFLVHQTTGTSANNRNTSVSLRWMSKGITAAGIGDATAITDDRFDSPYCIALGSSDTMYITDFLNNRVQKWTVDAIQGITVAGRTSGATGAGPNVLSNPTGIIVDENGNIYVSDAGNHRVQFWANGALTGTTTAGTGSVGSGNNELSSPAGLARDPNTGTLYIADANNDRIMKYTLGATAGTVAAGGNGRGTSNTQLPYPIGIYFDALSNSLFIANYQGHNIVRWVLGASSWTLVAGGLNNLTGSTTTLLNYPIGITLDPMGNLYVADAGNHRIQFFMAGQSIGKTIAGITTTYGKFSSLLYIPYWVILDNQLNLYVTDAANHRVQKFLRY